MWALAVGVCGCDGDQVHGGCSGVQGACWGCVAFGDAESF